jgi:hypothetical protein
VQGCRTLLGALIATGRLGLELGGDIRPATDARGVVNRLIRRQCLQFAALRHAPKHQRESKTVRQQGSE